MNILPLKCHKVEHPINYSILTMSDNVRMDLSFALHDRAIVTIGKTRLTYRYKKIIVVFPQILVDIFVERQSTMV